MATKWCVGQDREPAGWVRWDVLVHSGRTAIAAIVSVLAARLFRLPESYWAPITTLVITQSSSSVRRWPFLDSDFSGRRLGRWLGRKLWRAGSGRTCWCLGLACSCWGLICAVVRSDRSAYRFGGITLAIVLLIPRTGPAWQIAFHRFAEVSIGIGVALILAAAWPEREVAAPDK